MIERQIFESIIPILNEIMFAEIIEKNNGNQLNKLTVAYYMQELSSKNIASQFILLFVICQCDLLQSTDDKTMGGPNPKYVDQQIGEQSLTIKQIHYINTNIALKTYQNSFLNQKDQILFKNSCRNQDRLDLFIKERTCT
ncbi:hypothetical protein TTHERM_00858070 (macronuclear) [Tetrahymena thermophila SB210]|uniref:Uncharacterized protein n=1 Tax=Tetrahymena thermophila (strain SB210) TaxID=312017 RepID=Q23YV1_TETTS|nr:hypothetical protein TTHERM_00858070 [Tetrahymena thermophila SB210]EAS01704.2 hypothetical protein TTHERM_00858070 [Tetrahymena thermophila SB210]|eukprot:XP_001021949.2 hypothetical protein TTHERM_00858070 [Tetrahymena thermophila SB210]